jgi:hypothetical protein
VVVDRWYRTGDDTRHGRSYGLMTGGQLTGLAIARVVGVTCHQASGERAMPDESFWLMKAEAADGSTLAGWSSELLLGGAGACDRRSTRPPNRPDLVSAPTTSTSARSPSPPAWT